MLAIDTLETTRRLRDAGMSKESAVALTEVLRDAQAQSIENLVSKEYLDQKIESLELKLDHEIALLRKDMEQGNDLLRKNIE